MKSLDARLEQGSVDPDAIGLEGMRVQDDTPVIGPQNTFGGDRDPAGKIVMKRHGKPAEVEVDDVGCAALYDSKGGACGGGFVENTAGTYTLAGYRDDVIVRELVLGGPPSGHAREHESE